MKLASEMQFINTKLSSLPITVRQLSHILTLTLTIKLIFDGVTKFCSVGLIELTFNFVSYVSIEIILVLRKN